jgi:deoxyinosine 3'endonuclease (endonuclease V)
MDITRSLSLQRKFFSGVLCDVPTVGVAKNLYQMDGILRDDDQKHRISLLHEPGDHFALKTNSGNTLGLVSLIL